MRTTSCLTASALRDSVEWPRMYHQQNLQIRGISLPGSDVFTAKASRRMFREFRLQFSTDGSDLDPVSVKLPVVPADRTPYSFADGELFYEARPLNFPSTRVYSVPIPP